MEPDNRPYVAPDTKPGDAGTEEWADELPKPDAPVQQGPLANPAARADKDGIVDDSPADTFVNDPDAVTARNDEGDAS